MEAKAQAKYVRCTPRKARRVVDVVRGKRAVEAVNVLRFAPQAAAVPVRKVIESAIANARFKAERDGERFDENELFITLTQHNIEIKKTAKCRINFYCRNARGQQRQEQNMDNSRP